MYLLNRQLVEAFQIQEYAALHVWSSAYNKIISV